MIAVEASVKWPVGGGETGESIRAHDWAATPLGPLEHWPQSLRSAVDLVLGSPLPMAVLWGPEFIRLYNDAYRDLIGDKHPAGLGRSMQAVWPELSEFLQPIYAAVRRGEAFTLAGQKLTLNRYGRLEDAWFDLTYSPLRDESGGVAGILLTAFEVTEKVRGAAMLVERELRERMVLEAVSDAVFALDADWRITLVNRAAEEYMGAPRDQLLGRTMTEAFPTTQGSIYEERFRQVMCTGEASSFVAPSVAKAGRTIEMRVAPMNGGVVVSFSDVTGRKRTERALRRSEEQIRLVTDAMPALIGYVDQDQRYRFVNQRYAEWFERPQDQILGRSMRELLGAPLYARFRPRIERALAGELVRFDHRLQPEERVTQYNADAVLHLDVTYVPRIGPDGQAEGFYILVIDITEQKQAQEAQQVLVGELQHRTRNLLAIVRSVLNQTLKASGSLDDFDQRFGSRLASLGRVQSLLSQGCGHSVTMRDLILGELAAHGSGAGDPRVTIKGPRVDLPSKAVQVLALALHELATNALKHGALGQEQAKLSVRWEMSETDAKRFVTIRWIEDGVMLPPGDPAAKRGFGRQLIERALPYDLGAEARFSFAEDGVHCEIRVPVDGESA